MNPTRTRQRASNQLSRVARRRGRHFVFTDVFDLVMRACKFSKECGLKILEKGLHKKVAF